jgi:hypothetical protein
MIFVNNALGEEKIKVFQINFYLILPSQSLGIYENLPQYYNPQAQVRKIVDSNE